MKGLIIKGIAGFYYVKTENGVFQCKARGIFKKDGITPLVGDFAEIETLEDGNAVINTIYERKNEFVRPSVVNVDCFIVVIAAAKPEPNFSIIDKFLVMAEKNKAEAIICVNKLDLVTEEKARKLSAVYEEVYPVLCLSALEGSGIEALKRLMKDEKYALAGPSGSGKSTLLNALAPTAQAETGEISRKTARGKHTTRHTELFETDFGAMVYDTPGFTSFDVIDAEADEIQHFYPEIAKLYGKCRYKNCAHIKEAGCVVIEAVEAGMINRERYCSYREVWKEITGRRGF